MPLPYELILFDLDDTLLYFEDYWEKGTKEAFRQYPLTSRLDPDELFDVYRVHSAYYVDLYHRQQITIQTFRNTRFIRTLAEWGIEADEENANRFDQLYHRVSTTFMIPNPELAALLSRLQQCYKLGIVSNGTTQVQFDKMKAIGIEAFFNHDSVFISEQVGCEKPDRQIYLAALNHFQTAPEDTLFIGDSWKNDVEGPALLGIPSIWLNKKRESSRTHPLLKAVIHRIGDLALHIPVAP